MKNGSVNQTVRPKCQISMESQSCRLVVYPTQQVGSPTCNWDKQAQSTYNRGELTHLVSGMNQQSRKQATHSMGYWLVVSTPLKNMKNTSLDSYSQCFAKYKKNVPKHQPGGHHSDLIQIAYAPRFHACFPSNVQGQLHGNSRILKMELPTMYKAH